MFSLLPKQNTHTHTHTFMQKLCGKFLPHTHNKHTHTHTQHTHTQLQKETEKKGIKRVKEENSREIRIILKGTLSFLQSTVLH